MAFIHDDFMLQSQEASRLYHNYAENMPIFDYHCHLDPKDILEDRRYNDLAEMWLECDHYKWRLMRAYGVEEKYITGNADNYEKFLKWAQTVSKSMGNPIYHWTHLELKRYFNIDDLLSLETAPKIWEACNARIAESAFTVRTLIRRSNVKALCTTDDPIDDLSSHIEIARDKTFDVKVLPTFRPEKAISPESQDYAQYISRLSAAAGMKITTIEELIAALKTRAEFFKSVGCVISDHSFATYDFARGTLDEAESAFRKGLAGHKPDKNEIGAFKGHMLAELGRIYHSLGFVMQMHVGVIRNNNTRMFRQMGPDRGFDSIGDGISAESLAFLLDRMEQTDELPKTIIYSLNENDNAKIAAVIGCFQGGGIAGKLQLGSAWWFNDQKDGMLNQMKTVASIGLLGTFIGMLTDSRSFLSFARHEYFRRILCDLLGDWARKGEVPMDDDLIGGMVEDVCFNNVMDYFGLK